MQDEAKEQMMRFAEVDRDGNQQLDFDEFLAMQPPNIHEHFTVADIRWWFNSADKDGDGTVSVNEFFTWSLRNASLKYGTSALEAAFRKYDKDGTGHLDGLEFSMAATEMGFGLVAEEIFRSLDNDGSGSVSYSELVKALMDSSNAPKDPATKQMLSALMWTYNKPKDEVAATKEIDTSGWVINGRDSTSVRAELQQLMKDSGAHVADLIRLFGGSHASIDEDEFTQTMRTRLGFTGPLQILRDVFASIDADASGSVGFDELFEFVRGQKHSLDRRAKSLFDTRFDVPEGMTLDMIAWDANVLRDMLGVALTKHHVGPADLLRHWAKKGKRGLNLSAFCTGVYTNFFAQEDLDLWENEVHAAAKEVFKIMISLVKGENFLRQVGILHFETWMQGAVVREKLPLKSPAQLREQRARREHAATQRRKTELERKLAYEAEQLRVKAKPLPKPRSPRPLHQPSARHRHWVPTAKDYALLKGISPDLVTPIATTSHLLTTTSAFDVAHPRVSQLSPRPRSPGRSRASSRPVSRSATSPEPFQLPPPSREIRKLQHALFTASTLGSIDFYAPHPNPPQNAEPSLTTSASLSSLLNSRVASADVRASSRVLRRRRARSKEDRIFDSLVMHSTLSAMPPISKRPGSGGPLLTFGSTSGSLQTGGLWS